MDGLGVALFQETPIWWIEAAKTSEICLPSNRFVTDWNFAFSWALKHVKFIWSQSFPWLTVFTFTWLHVRLLSPFHWSGWWYTYPSEKYESQLGWWNVPIYGKLKVMFQSPPTSYSGNHGKSFIRNPINLWMMKFPIYGKIRHVPVTTNQPLLITINPLFIHHYTTINPL